LIDYESLMGLLKVERMADLKEVYRGWVEESLGKEELGRQSRWTESIAVGSKAFVEDTKEKLGIKATGREVIGGDGVYELREAESSYDALFGPENSDLSSKNAYYWDLFH